MSGGDRLEDVSLELPMGWDLFRRSPKSVGVISNIAAKDFFLCWLVRVRIFGRKKSTKMYDSFPVPRDSRYSHVCR